MEKYSIFSPSRRVARFAAGCAVTLFSIGGSRRLGAALPGVLPWISNTYFPAGH